MKKGDVDITVMKVVVEGRKKKKKLRYVYDLIDRYDAATQTHSMARTTGYTATGVIHLLAEGLYECGGICPPEFIGRRPECVAFLLKYLRERGVVYDETVETPADD